MTKEELIERLNGIDNKVRKGEDNGRLYDTENGHKEADALIIEFINDKEIEEVYDSVQKWYA